MVYWEGKTITLAVIIIITIVSELNNKADVLDDSIIIN